MSWIEKQMQKDLKITGEQAQHILNEMERIDQLPEEEQKDIYKQLEHSVRKKENKYIRRKYFGPLNYTLGFLGVFLGFLISAILSAVWDTPTLMISDGFFSLIWMLLASCVVGAVAFIMRNTSPRYIWFIGCLIFGLFASQLQP